jgi:hypothetical protein
LKKWKVKGDIIGPYTYKSLPPGDLYKWRNYRGIYFKL